MEKKDWRERIGINIDKKPYEITLDGQPIRCVNHLEKWVEKILEQELDRARGETFTKEEWDLILYAVSGSANKDTGAYDEMCDKFDNEYGEPKNETVEAFDKLLDKVEQLRLSKLTTK